MYFLHILFTGSQQGPHEKRLLNNLLGPYNILERPVANESESLEVKFGLTLQQIIDVVSIAFITLIDISYGREIFTKKSIKSDNSNRQNMR